MSVRPWQPEVKRLCCHFVFESDETMDPRLPVSKSRQPGSAGMCWKVSLTIAIYLQFKQLVKWSQTAYLGRCCFGEVGGTTAACASSSSATVCAINIFISAVQQWELEAARNHCHSLAQLPALTSSCNNKPL